MEDTSHHLPPPGIAAVVPCGSAWADSGRAGICLSLRSVLSDLEARLALGGVYLRHKHAFCTLAF